MDSTNERRTTNENCESLRDLLPAYSMGITDPHETALVERLLPDCPEVEAELSDYESLADVMPFSAAQIVPPPNLGERILKAASETATSQQQTVISLQRRTLYFAGSIAAAITLILLGIIVAQTLQLNDLRNENRTLLAQVTTRDNLLALAGEDRLARFPLEPAAGNLLATATVICNRDSNAGVLRIDGFAASTPGMAYQAWLIRGEERLSAGVFEVGADGVATLVFSSPVLLGEIEYVGITPEPAGGSARPTGDPIVFGPLWPRNDESQS